MGYLMRSFALRFGFTFLTVKIKILRCILLKMVAYVNNLRILCVKVFQLFRFHLYSHCTSENHHLGSTEPLISCTH